MCPYTIILDAAFYSLEYALPQVCGSENTMFLIFHVILGDHNKSYMTLWVGDPHNKSPLCQVWWSQAMRQ